MPELARAADPVRGEPHYLRNCAACHNIAGSGVRGGTAGTDLGYVIPPLWGQDTFNDGAGMARIITLANFIHFNMPHGADYLNPQVSVEGALGTSRLSFCRIRGRTWPAPRTTFPIY
jgi:thiosulfate dehydrogenase